MKEINLDKIVEKWDGATVSLNEKGFPVYTKPAGPTEPRILPEPWCREILQATLHIAGTLKIEKP